MSVHCYKITEEKKFKPCQLQEAILQANATDGKIWFDIQTPEEEILEELLFKLQMNAFAIRLCREARDKPGFYPLNNFVLMVIPVLTAEENEREMDYITILCRENFVLTIRDSANMRIQKITTLDESTDWLTHHSVSGFVSAIIMFLSLELLQRLSDLRQSIIVVEKQMDQEPELGDIKILSLKRTRLLVLEAIISSQIPTFQALQSADKSYFSAQSVRDYLSNAIANLEAADRSLIWLGGRIDVIRGDLEMLSQEKMNRRLGMLTTLSVIFMPMTFLAGIWGMNFINMPELSTRFGYLFAISSMLILGGGLFFYFRRKGWFE